MQSIDKDRAEVVMDVNIYEVTKSDFLQFGNQVGQVGSDGTFTLGGSPGFGFLAITAHDQWRRRGVNLSVNRGRSADCAGGGPCYASFGAHCISKQEQHEADRVNSGPRFQRRRVDRPHRTTRPVQTAQPIRLAFKPELNTQWNNDFPTGGFPVINYEPTGLTLKFTPQVFPNLDVQVKMTIESKDVLGAST